MATREELDSAINRIIEIIKNVVRDSANTTEGREKAKAETELWRSRQSALFVEYEKTFGEKHPLDS